MSYMYKIPRIMTSQELLDKAYRRLDKIQLGVPNLSRRREISHSKLNVLVDTINTSLGKYVKSFPSFDSIEPIYGDLIRLLVDMDQLKMALGRVSSSRQTIMRIAGQCHKKISASRKLPEVENARKHAYGRVSSVVEKLDRALSILAQARIHLKSLPDIDMNVPTIVVAGSPNVGKSLLVLQISTANPKIAVYPFTTKNIIIGHFEHHRLKYQIIDTPGILDRPLEKRNEIERQAILAVRYLADIILFVFDPTEECGYGMEAQENLAAELKATFSEIPFIEVDNKSDKIQTKNKRRKVSAHTSEGIAPLVDVLTSEIDTSEKVIQY